MKMNSPPDSTRAVSPLTTFRMSIDSSAPSPCAADDLRLEDDVDVRPGRDLLDEVAGHALLERVAAVEDRHALRVCGEEHRRLAGRVSRADEVDVEAVRVRGLAARGAIEDPSPGELVEAWGIELPPRDAAREDDRARAQDVAAVEVDAVRGGVDARDLPRDDDLGAEPPRLQQRASRQRVAGDARREAEVVLDPRRRPGLASRAPRTRSRSSAAPPTRRTRQRRDRQARRRRSRCRTPPTRARSGSRGAPRHAAAAAGRRPCRR